MKLATNSEPSTLDDFIFQNRNQKYGAYYIRSTYNRAVQKAFAFTVSGTVLVILLLFQSAFKNDVKTIYCPIADVPLNLQTYEIPPPDQQEKTPASQTSSKPPKSDIAIYKPEEKIKTEPKPADPKMEVPPVSNPDPNGKTGGDPNATVTSKNPNSGSSEEIKAGNNEVAGSELTWADEMPEFIGGEQALRNYITTHFKVPNNIEEDNLKIRLYFVVDESGKVTDIKINKGVSDDLNEEAIRVVSQMPNWKPGKMNGKLVKVRYYLPIHIKFR